MIQKFIHFYIVVCWGFFIFILLTLPMPVNPNSGMQITYADKLVHFFIFGLLSYFTAKALGLLTQKHHCSVIVASLLITAIYGYLLEYLQESIPGRSSSLFDLSAGLAGSLIGIWAYQLIKKYDKPRLLLHICCAPCGAYVSRLLGQSYKLTLFYYNPNIDSPSEYEKRKNEVEKIAKRFGYNLIIEPYEHGQWLKAVRGLENEPERGKRCLVCYADRLEATAKQASISGFAFFASTLTVSPHKLADEIGSIGSALAQKYRVSFLNQDFKKQDGYKKSLVLSDELHLYRQNYCGCEFSKKASVAKAKP